MAPMRPLPFAPISTVLDFAELRTGSARRLELWNLDPRSSGGARLSYIVLSEFSEPGGAPSAMVTTRMWRTPDNDIDSATGTGRLVPAAELSILTIPLRPWQDEASYGDDRLSVSDSLLRALEAEDPPWETAECIVDGISFEWCVLRGGRNELWVGEYRDATASIIRFDTAPTSLLLRSLNEAEKIALTRPADPAGGHR